jgi:hypothetical protein
MVGAEVLQIMDYMDKRVGETEERLMTVIREGRVAHTQEHKEQQLVCQHAMLPLEQDFARRSRNEERRVARVEPLVRAAVWVTNHWQVSIAVAAGTIWLLVHAGVLQP